MERFWLSDFLRNISGILREHVFRKPCVFLFGEVEDVAFCCVCGG